MKKNTICYILLSKKESPLIRTHIENDTQYITILEINPNLFSGFMKGRRYYSIYCDMEFLSSSWGRTLVKEIFEPMALSEFILI